jgi:hypothetical protein
MRTVKLGLICAGLEQGQRLMRKHMFSWCTHLRPTGTRHTPATHPPGVVLAAFRNFSNPWRGPLSVQLVPSTYSCSRPRYFSTLRSACTCGGGGGGGGFCWGEEGTREDCQDTAQRLHLGEQKMCTEGLAGREDGGVWGSKRGQQRRCHTWAQGAAAATCSHHLQMKA